MDLFKPVRTGVTGEMIAFSKHYTVKTHGGHHIVKGQPVSPRDRVLRDRRLNGKARIRARKARNLTGW